LRVLCRAIEVAPATDELDVPAIREDEEQHPPVMVMTLAAREPMLVAGVRQPGLRPLTAVETVRQMARIRQAPRKRSPAHRLVDARHRITQLDEAGPMIAEMRPSPAPFLLGRSYAKRRRRRGEAPRVDTFK